MDPREELFQPRPVRIYRDDWNGLYLYLRAAAPHRDPGPQSPETLIWGKEDN